MYYDHSICTYGDHSTCKYYDHVTCMYSVFRLACTMGIVHACTGELADSSLVLSWTCLLCACVLGLIDDLLSPSADTRNARGKSRYY